MRWLNAVGVLLIVVGLGGAVAAYRSSASAPEATGPAPGLDGRMPADDANASTWPGLGLATLSGLSLAFGVGCIGVGMGRWTRPVPSQTRPANPYSEQPIEGGQPPVGLV